MINTLLIDLDDTLLLNDMDRFLPVYLDSISKFMVDLVPQEKFISELMRGTQAMLENKDPERTLEQVFADIFYPAISIPQSEMQIAFDRFYREVYPDLRELTQPVPESRALIKFALEQEMIVVIATNPLFPRLAVEQRLDWAGIPSSDFSYNIVTSYECFHFAKPKSEYYAEILALLGVHPHQAAMIGNDAELDLLPAQSLGMAIFQVASNPINGIPGGDLGHAQEWITQAHKEADASAIYQPSAIMSRLRGNLSALLNLTKDVDQNIWQSRPAQNEWSPTEVLCHLRDVELEVNIPRMEIILNETDPFLSAADPDSWAEERDYIRQSGPDAMATLTKARKHITLQTLDRTRESEWSRRARHAILGPTTLAEIMTVATEHELLHLKQLKEALSSCKANFPGIQGGL